MGHVRLLAVAGCAGLLFGLAATTAGAAGGEFGQMLSGYGLLVMGAAAYLLLGLGVRWLLGRRARPTRSPVRVTAQRRA
jgi:hypothetical protein